MSLNESPSEKEGKLILILWIGVRTIASMKVPPKRKGNYFRNMLACSVPSLNESPSEKEGK